MLSVDLKEVEFELPPGPFTKTRRRRSLWVRVAAGDGVAGRGEAAPLPDYSPDSLPEVRAFLMDWSPPSRLPESLDEVKRTVQSIPVGLPSARFAVETALLDLMAQGRACSVSALFGSVQETLEVAHVVGGEQTPDNPAAIKMKIGQTKDEPNRLRELRRKFPSREIRLDAGGRAIPRETRQVAEAIAPSFVEEPPDDWVTIPRALDESLGRALAMNSVPKLENAVAAVLKPTMLGGMLRAREIAQEAKSRGMRVIASHTLEGVVGYTAVCHFALSVMKADEAAGLAPAIAPQAESPSWNGMRIEASSQTGLGLAVS